MTSEGKSQDASEGKSQAVGDHRREVTNRLPSTSEGKHLLKIFIPRAGSVLFLMNGAPCPRPCSSKTEIFTAPLAAGQVSSASVCIPTAANCRTPSGHSTTVNDKRMIFQRLELQWPLIYNQISIS